MIYTAGDAEALTRFVEHNHRLVIISGLLLVLSMVADETVTMALKTKEQSPSRNKVGFVEKEDFMKKGDFMKTVDRRIFNAAMLLVIYLVGTQAVASAHTVAVPENPVWPRPTLVPIPVSIAGVEKPVVLLDNAWKMQQNPQGEFWDNSVDLSSWSDAAVGGRSGRRGGRSGGAFLIAYKKKITIPAEFKGKRTILRFESVAHGARVWVNGQFIRDHWGYLPWSCDISEHVTAGEEVWLTVEVDTSREGLAAFVRAGGIQGDIRLIAVPQDYITRFHTSTVFDRQYRNATLQVWLTIFFRKASSARVRLILKDMEGNTIVVNPDTIGMTRYTPDILADVMVSNPKKWDAEHPNLYTLQAQLLVGDEIVQTLSRTIGFREVKVVGNQFFVNGKEVKFRGIWGGGDVASLQEINANHTRQKWVSEQFLNECDRMGMYVLDENPVDFAKYGPESDPECTHQWLNLIADQLERDRSHPCVIMWGLGNESFHGENILKAFKYVSFEDKQRPTMYSWANRVPPDEELPYTVYSSHYPNLNDPNMGLGDYTVAKWHSSSLVKQRNPVPVMPVLHDEYCHTVLNQELVARDPGVRNFWGESIYRYWEKMFVTPGALGGDIFGLQRGGRSAPEPYLVRKAYSPVRIENKPLPNPGSGRALDIPIKNWFDHTNLNELKVEWAVGDETGTQSGPDVAPHDAGTLQIPARNWRDGDELSLKFYVAGGRMVDGFLLVINPPEFTLPRAQGPAPRLEEDPNKIVVTGQDFRVVFDKYRGLISEGSYKGKTVIIDGPFVNLLGSGLAVGEWWCDSISAHTEGNEVVVDIISNYAVIEVSFQVRIDGTGLITTKYTLDYVPGEPPQPTWSPWNATSVGGYDEVGVAFVLTGDIDRLSWKHKGLWSVYPEDHIGRNAGIAQRDPGEQPAAQGQRGFQQAGGIFGGARGAAEPTASDDFRSTKENIYYASAIVVDSESRLTALSDGRDAVRMEIFRGYRALTGGVRMNINNQWNYPDLGLGSYAKPPIMIGSGYSNEILVRLADGDEVE